MDVARYVWNGISGLFSACFSTVGAWIPATYAIYRTDTNVCYQIFCFVVMFIANLATVLGICWIVAYAYFQIVSAVASSLFPLQTSVVALVAIVTISILCHPVICYCIRFANIVPAVVLFLCGHREAAGAFANTIMNREHQRAITD